MPYNLLLPHQALLFWYLEASLGHATSPTHGYGGHGRGQGPGGYGHGGY